MATRTDPHSPARIRPDDYSHVLEYSLATTVDGWPVPSWNIDLVIELRKTEAFANIHTATNQCDVCGASFLHGSIWRHDPTGEHIKLGHMCADKYEFAADLLAQRAPYEAMKRGAAARAVRHAKLVQGCKSLGAQLRDSAPALRAALRRCREHKILADLLAKGIEWGSLTEKQVALAIKLAADLDRPVEVYDGKPAEGRAKIEGLVLATKTYDNAFGIAYKMLVAVDGPDGKWKAWGTVPTLLLDTLQSDRQKLLDELDEAAELAFHQNRRAAHGRLTDVMINAISREHRELEPAPTGNLDALRGRRVRFAAKFEPSNTDPHFARFSRPTQAALLEA